MTETFINHYEIHHIRNNWLGPILFSAGDSHTKGLPVLFYLGLKVSSRLTLIQNGDLRPLRLLSLMTKFSSTLPIQGILPGNNWQSGEHFFEGLQSCMENKIEGNENKIILGDFNCNMDKMDRHCGNKTQ